MPTCSLLLCVAFMGMRLGALAARDEHSLQSTESAMAAYSIDARTNSTSAYQLMVSAFINDTANDCVPTTVPPKGGAYEIANIPFGKVYLTMKAAAGAYTQEEYDVWKPTKGYVKNPNGVRETTFDAICLYASPGHDSVRLVTLGTYPDKKYKDLQYRELADICPSKYGLGMCSPAPCNKDMAPQKGSLKVIFMAMCGKRLWRAGKTIDVLTDPSGGKYVMHAWDFKRGAPNARPELYPSDWTLSKETLKYDLISMPTHPESVGKLGGKNFGEYPCGLILLNDAEGHGWTMFHDGGYFAAPRSGWHKIMHGICPSTIVGYIPFVKSIFG